MALDSDVLHRLITAAQQAAEQAYCPYSHFPVGAAVLASDGKIYSGCNVENASSGLTICAERAAVCQAIVAGQRRLLAVVIFTPTQTPTAPCGACRQVLNEFGAIAQIVCCCDGPNRIETSLESLLPFAFGPANLSPLLESQHASA